MMNSKAGIPKTLSEAIKNGLEDLSDEDPVFTSRAIEIMHRHIQNYLIEQFQMDLLFVQNEQHEKLNALFQKIVKKD